MRSRAHDGGLVVDGRSLRLLTAGLAVMAASFFTFYGGHLLGLPVTNEVFLLASLAGFCLVVAGRMLASQSVRDLIVLPTALALFSAATASLLSGPGFRFGRWDFYVFMLLMFAAFLTSGFLPVRKVEYTRYGLAGAFIASFFFEMFGFPLTLYLMSTAMGLGYRFSDREALEAAHLLVSAGLASSELIHFASALLVLAGLTLTALGHVTLYSGRGRIVDWGVYRYIKHPQYAGLVIMTGGMLVEYPTLVPALMWAALLVMYLVKARQEGREIKRLLNKA